jgi:hypothetical protein
MGGTVTGEHGVGVEKLNSMCVQFSARSASRCSASSAPSIPQGPAEPGKVIPTLNRCAEYGKKMLVRGGRLGAPGPAALSLVSQYGVRILLAVVVSTLAGLLVTVLTLHLLRDRGDDGPKEPPHA